MAIDLMPGFGAFTNNSVQAAPALWNSSDISTNGFTGTNGNRTVTSSVSAWKSVRITSTKSTGKLYCELSGVSIQTGINWIIGLASSGFDATDKLGTSDYSAGLRFDGHYPASGISVANGTGWSVSTPETAIYALAVDLDAGKAWILQNNVVVVGDPVAGTTPTFTFSIGTTGPLAVALSLYSPDSPGDWTVNSLAADQTYSPPSGYSEWG
jgi:hypothetical protein